MLEWWEWDGRDGAVRDDSAQIPHGSVASRDLLGYEQWLSPPLSLCHKYGEGRVQ